jgi:hypothetical protein
VETTSFDQTLGPMTQCAQRVSRIETSETMSSLADGFSDDCEEPEARESQVEGKVSEANFHNFAAPTVDQPHGDRGSSITSVQLCLNQSDHSEPIWSKQASWGVLLRISDVVWVPFAVPRAYYQRQFSLPTYSSW